MLSGCFWRRLRVGWEGEDLCMCVRFREADMMAGAFQFAMEGRCLVMTRSIFFFCLVAGCCFASVSDARGEVRLPHMLSDHAVLQRQMPVHIWGWADAGEKVSVTFH